MFTRSSSFIVPESIPGAALLFPLSSFSFRAGSEVQLCRPGTPPVCGCTWKGILVLLGFTWAPRTAGGGNLAWIALECCGSAPVIDASGAGGGRLLIVPGVGLVEAEAEAPTPLLDVRALRGSWGTVEKLAGIGGGR